MEKKLKTENPIIKLQSESVFGYWFGNSLIAISIGVLLFRFFGDSKHFFKLENIIYICIIILGIVLGYISFNIYTNRIFYKKTEYIKNTKSLRTITQLILLFLTFGVIIGLFKNTDFKKYVVNEMNKLNK
tara:strand:+ start:3332 stop:3721 length:390 start_codon:yes stop_codon:yes gene_type:complete